MSLEFEETPLGAEVQKILKNGATSTNYTWEVTVHTPEKNLKPLNAMSINFIRDYSGGFGDEITISTLFGRGTFAHQILPFREKLEVTLKRIPTNEAVDTENAEGDIQAERFTALLVGDFVSPSLGQGREAKDEFSLNAAGIEDIHFQLQDKACEQLRVLMAGGIGRKTNVQNYLTTIIARDTANLKVNGERALKGVDMIDADNKDVKEQIVVTQGTRLVDLADFIQKRVGVYNSGLGSYIQNGYWYIFPLYDTTEFNRRVKTLTMLVVPENKMSNVERTFRTEAGSTTILVTGKTAFRDDAGSNYQNYGNGVRFAHAGKLMDANSATADNKTKVTRGQNNGEFVTDESTLKYAPVASNRITANPFPSLSLQASKRGGMFRAIWQNSDHSLVYPGMVVKIVYSEDDAMKDVYGIVHGLIHVSHKPGGLTSPRYTNQSVIDVFVNNQIKPLDD
jgi:hypothetical protein